MVTEIQATTPPTEDYYPSRCGLPAHLRSRLDPVIYPKDWMSAPIAEVWLECYLRQGFMVLPDVFSKREVAVFREELKRLGNDPEHKASDATVIEPGSGEIRSVFNVHKTSPVFRNLATDRRLAGLAQFILADSVYIHQSRVNYKPGFRGREFYWHSDFETWHVEDGMPSMRAMSISIALTDNFTYNGSLMLIPGSHRWYAVCEGETPAQHYRLSLKKQEYGVPSDDCLKKMVNDGGGIVTATGKAGSVIVFDCNVMHGSNGNITPLPRSNVFFVYNAVTNHLQRPFSGQPPRPEYLAARSAVEPVDCIDQAFVR